MRKITVSLLLITCLSVNMCLAQGSYRNHESSAIFYFAIAGGLLVVGFILKNLPGKDNNR